MSTRAVYEPRELYNNRNPKLKRKHFWSTQLGGVSTAILSKAKASLAQLYNHQRGIAVYQQPSKTTANALLDDTAVSTRAVNQPRELYINRNQNLKRKHFWSTQPCRKCGLSTAISKAIAYPAQLYNYQRGIAVYQQQSKTKSKALLDDTAVSTRTVYQPQERYINNNQTLKRKQFWTTQPCRPGRCISRDQQSKSISGVAVCH